MSPAVRSVASPTYARMLIRAQRRFNATAAAMAPPAPGPAPTRDVERRQPARASTLRVLELAVA